MNQRNYLDLLDIKLRNQIEDYHRWESIVIAFCIHAHTKINLQGLPNFIETRNARCWLIFTIISSINKLVNRYCIDVETNTQELTEAY